MYPRIAILTNMVAPYRAPLYAALARWFDVTVLVGQHEPNRPGWENFGEQLNRSGVAVRRVAGVTLERDRGPDKAWIHIEPGYAVELLRVRPHAVVSAEIGWRSLIAMLWHAATHTPTWIWWEGTAHAARHVGGMRWVLRRLFARKAPRWISAGTSASNYLLSLGVPRARILEVQNCTDESLFRPCRPAVNIEPRPVLLYVGQLIRRKGIQQLLEAASRLQSRGAVFSVLIVGDGPEREALQSRCRALGLSNVHWLGNRAWQTLPAIYSSADCLVFPTLEDVWGFVVNEAILCGLPVASSIYAGSTVDLVPPENSFDPLEPADFDRILDLAVTGRLVRSDPGSLLSIHEAAEILARDILHRIRS